MSAITTISIDICISISFNTPLCGAPKSENQEPPWTPGLHDPSHPVGLKSRRFCLLRSVQLCQPLCPTGLCSYLALSSLPWKAGSFLFSQPCSFLLLPTLPPEVSSLNGKADHVPVLKCFHGSPGPKALCSKSFTCPAWSLSSTPTPLAGLPSPCLNSFSS